MVTSGAGTLKSGELALLHAFHSARKTRQDGWCPPQGSLGYTAKSCLNINK